jgi:predicted transcriptional regulator
MPKPLAVDWDQAKCLYIKGMSLADIANQMGVSPGALRTRAHRYKWAESLSQTQAKVQHVVTEQIKTGAQGWIPKIDRYVHEVIDDLLQRGASSFSPKDLRDLVACATQVNQMARETYGMNAESKTIHVGLIQPVVEIKLTQGVEMTKQAQVVDVQDVKPE